MLCDVGDCRVRDDRFADAPIADQVEIVLGQLRLVELLAADVWGKIQGMNLRPRQVEGNEPGGGPIVGADFQHYARFSIAQQTHQCDLIMNS